MIHNKNQLAQAQKAIQQLKQKIDELGNEVTDPIVFLQKIAWENRLNDLNNDISEYTYITTQPVLEFTVEKLPKLIMYLRIASGLTQKDLAEEIEVKEQQIQRYEQNHYLTASFERVIQIIRVLSKNLHIQTETISKKGKSSPLQHIYDKYPTVLSAQKEIAKRKELVITPAAS